MDWQKSNKYFIHKCYCWLNGEGGGTKYHIILLCHGRRSITNESYFTAISFAARCSLVASTICIVAQMRNDLQTSMSMASVWATKSNEINMKRQWRTRRERVRARERENNARHISRPYFSWLLLLLVLWSYFLFLHRINKSQGNWQRLSTSSTIESWAWESNTETEYCASKSIWNRRKTDTKRSQRKEEL